MNQKKINLETEVSYVVKEHFTANEFAGKTRLFFRYTERQFLSDSITWGAATADFLPAPTDQNLNMKGGGGSRSAEIEFYGRNDTFHNILLEKETYLIAERGEMGFSFSADVLLCEITEADEAYDVRITAVTDETIKEKALKVNVENGWIAETLFSDKVYNQLEKICRGAYHPSPRELYEAYNSTGFINIPTDGSYVKIKLNLHKPGNDETIEYNINSHEVKTLDGKSVWREKAEKGKLLFRKNPANITSANILDYSEILEIEDIVHDMHGNFAAAAKIILIYPYDATEIKERFPDFYKDYCVSRYFEEKQQRLNGTIEVPFVNEEFIPGAETVYQKLFTTQFAMGIKKGVFISNRRYAPVHNAEGEKLLRCGGGKATLFTLLEADGLYNIVEYTSDTIVRCGGEYFAKLDYSKETGFKAWADDSCDDETAKQFNHAAFLICQGQATPTSVSRTDYEERLKLWKKDPAPASKEDLEVIFDELLLKKGA